MLLPEVRTPQLNYSNFVMTKIFQEYDKEFVAFNIEKNFSSQEKMNFLKKYNELNSRFNRKSLITYFGLEKPIQEIDRVRCLIEIDCREGNFMIVSETYYDYNGKLIHDISPEDDQRYWTNIEPSSVIDDFARIACKSMSY
jgi:hypothetical protein